MASYAQRRAGARNGARLTELAIREEKARQQVARDAEHRAGVERRRAEREAEKARRKFTQVDLAGVSHVRDSIGWHRVVRVNPTTVTVETGYSWTDRIPHEKILGYARDGKKVA